MAFSSIVFVFYFLPFALALYYLVGAKSIRVKNLLLLAVSLVFYAWGEPRNIVLLLGSCLLNWGAALLLGRCRRHRKPLLALSSAGNLGLLFAFKYYAAAAAGLNRALGAAYLPAVGLTLPAGLSFFTLHALSYLIDIYRDEAGAQKYPWDTALYLMLFPKLMAGPVMRYRAMEEQMRNREHSWELLSEGTARFVQGFAKKVFLADSLAVIADNVFELTGAGHLVMTIPVSLAWLGSFAFTLQICLDLSAYSDMAIGLGKMFGFRLDENVRYPYLSHSMNEFWRRWHISLGAWFQEYVYNPLGGPRTERMDRMIQNTLIVWLLIGLWHGAGWNFLLWGMLQAMLLVFERLLLFERRSRGGILSRIYTLFMVNLSWVIFRCESFRQTQEYIGNMFRQFHNPIFSSYTWMFLRENAPVWLLGVLLCTPVFHSLKERAEERWPRAACALYPLGMLGLLALSAVYTAKAGTSPFVYFRY